MDDDELITTWGLVVEGFAGVSSKLTADLSTSNDIAPTSFEVLLRLFRTPGQRIPMSQLAAEVSFSSGGFTKLADRLESLNLVRRQSCPVDRRVIWVELTDHGKRVVKKAMVNHANALRAEVLNILGERDMEKLGKIMRKLRDEGAVRQSSSPDA
jgi:DNA-binding MarR family transcriptional regulator